MALAGCVDAEELRDLRLEAEDVQERAIKIYERQGKQTLQAIHAREVLTTIETAISERDGIEAKD